VSHQNRNDQQKMLEIIVKAGDLSATVVSFAAIGTLATMIFPGVAIGVGSIAGGTVGLGLGLCFSKFSGLWNKKTVLDKNVNTFKPIVEIKKQMSLDEMSVLEQSIDNLAEVLIVSHQIQQPDGRLLNSVEKNFAKKVQYTFLISRDSYREEVTKDYSFFVDIANNFIENSSTIQEGIEIDKFIRIIPLKINWDDNPYIFYITRKEDRVESAIVFRGNALNQGICDCYNLVERDNAPAFYNCLLASIDWQGDMQGDMSKLKNHEFITSEEFAKYNIARVK
jgi:hypothetical protein